MSLIKRITDKLRRKPLLVKPVVSKRFCVNYVVDGNLAIELQYYCDATCENMARYDFWDTHNELYHDIISVNVC